MLSKQKQLYNKNIALDKFLPVWILGFSQENIQTEVATKKKTSYQINNSTFPSE